ncbi:MAG TPA: transporter [Gammaproteobacteria bacterium]|nr:transporter [Gammaproteobacteria bacterium]
MKMMRYGILVCVSVFAANLNAHTPWSGARPDGHAPIGVMGDHIHKKGEWMLSYRYMRMEMDGMRDGTDDLSDAEVLADFMVTPTKMTTDMHMAGAMYAVSDDLTLMVMVPWLKKHMDHLTRMGTTFSTSSEGLGDVKVSGLLALKRWDQQQIHLNLGISMPTGDINESDDTPAMQNARLPYPMQLGSGTWDLLPGITYLGQHDEYSWGGQLLSTLRIGENDNDYTLGNRFEASGWGAYEFSDWWSGSLRMRWQTWGNIDGDDDKLNPAMVPTADPDRQGGTRADLLAGINFYARTGLFKGHRLAIEGGLPVYENLDGPQMSTDWMVTAGWQYAFH